MPNSATEEIFNYWNSLRGVWPAPLRSEIDPSALRHFLPNLFIASAAAPDALTFALAGTRICDLFDRELRGQEFSSIWADSAGDRPGEIARTILLYERPALLDIDLYTDGDGYSCDLLLMPVRSTARASDRILGALAPRSGSLPPFMPKVEAFSLTNWGLVEKEGVLPRLVEEPAKTGAPASFIRKLIGNSIFAPS